MDRQCFLQKSLEGKVATTIVVRADQSKKAPLSYAQQQMWLLDQLPIRAVYPTQSLILSASNDPDPDILAETLTRIQQRHETLRTTFAAIDGEPYQVINEAQPFSLSVTDLTDKPEKLANRPRKEKFENS